MIKLAQRAILLLATATITIANAHAASGNSVDLLSFIPADTPYAFVSTEPLPRKVADKLEPTVAEILQVYQRILRHMMAEQMVKMAAEEGGADKAEKFRSLMEEVLGLVSLEGIRGAGIERNSAFALYGNGLLPVLRLELSDDGLFDAAIERIEKQAANGLLLGSARGESYKYADADDMRLLIATVDDQAIVTVVPVQFDESQIADALGLKKPRASLKSSKVLRAISKEYGFSDYLTGFIDNRRIAGIFAGLATERDKQTFAAFSQQPPALSETCAAEVMEMVGIAPRIVFGYSEISSDHIKSSLVVELRKDIAQSLATVPAGVPGLGSDPGGFMSIGVGLNPLALRDFYAARLDAMEAEPYECEKFAELQAGVAKGRDALNQPVPPVVYSFRGFFANIMDMPDLDFGSSMTPGSVDASVLIAVENAESIIMMAAMMDPEFAALNLLPDGKARKLELAKLQDFADVSYAALSKDAVSVAVGANAEAKSADMLLAPSPDPAPFMSVSVDAARYYAMVGEAMKKQPSGDAESEMPEAVRSAMAELMALSGRMYKRMSGDIRFTARGIEVGGTMTLGD
jgi:hypothetical protein